MARLPNPGSDEGQWGSILNDYLVQSLDTGGFLKSDVVGTTQLQDGSVTVTKLAATGPTNGQVLTYNGGSLSWTTVSGGGSVPDADGSTKGLIQLAGALGGTAASPTVPGLAAKENTITAGTTGQYWRGDKSWQTLDKVAVGLANVDNTSDANKPISGLTQTALNNKVGITLTVTGATSLTGGGDLTTNRTLSLVNDSASPGNNKYYGTNGLGTKGYHDVPSGASSLITINAQTSTSYTLVLGDGGALVTLTNAAAITLTVPTNASVAFPVGSHIMLAQMGAGQVTVAAAGGVSVFADPGLKIAAQYGGAELIKTATDTWLLVGRLAA